MSWYRNDFEQLHQLIKNREKEKARKKADEIKKKVEEIEGEAVNEEDAETIEELLENVKKYLDHAPVLSEAFVERHIYYIDLAEEGLSGKREEIAKSTDDFRVDEDVGDDRPTVTGDDFEQQNDKRVRQLEDEVERLQRDIFELEKEVHDMEKES